MLLRTRTARLVVVGAALTSMALSGCDWKGANSLPLPGTAGSQNSYTIKVQLPDVTSMQENTRVRVNDVNVGNISKIELEDRHALVTVRLDGNVTLPANATASVGQTSLLGTLHLELAAPLNQPPEGKLKDGDTIPLDHAGAYPTTEQTLASVSVVLNGGGLSQLQEIDQELNAALSGRESDVRSLLGQLETVTRALEAQTGDIIAATEGLDRLSGTVNQQIEVFERALEQIPPALAVLNQDHVNLAAAITSVGGFADVSNQTIKTSREDIIANLRAIAAPLRELANAGPDLTRSLGTITTFPWPQSKVPDFVKGDFANLSATVDLTLGRLDNSFLTGTPSAGTLIAIETMLGRTEGRGPTPDVKNPLTAPLGDGIIRGGQ
jgi:phospholipid/cholesterol/gamma-HCH transport system substrate-binding protein